MTQSSRIFGASDVPGATLSIDLEAYGYVEEEYFLAGTADSYRRAKKGAVPDKTGIAYTTRIIVRRPADRSRFSGVVHFEPIHPSQGGTTHWLTTGRYMMGQGDVYVAAAISDDRPSRRISAEGPAPTAQSQVTKWFDPVRYAPLSWPQEDGIAYDVMASIGKLLRSEREDNPLKGWPVKAMLVGGWSFTGSIQRTFINEGFHDRARLPGGKPVFDGYLIGISSRWNGGGYVPLNSEEPQTANADPRRTLRTIDVPVIEFLSEFEAATGPGPQVPDREGKAGGHRLYEMGGTIHSSSMTDPRQPRSERPNLAQLAAKGYPLDAVRGETTDEPCSAPLSDVDHPAYIRASLDALRHWVLDGVEPPHIAPLVRDGDKIARDAAGNPLGGVRAAEFVVPLAGYGPYKGTDKPGCFPAKGRPIFVRNDLPHEDLVSLYTSRAEYLREFDAAVDALVSARWLLESDARDLKMRARSRSLTAFEAP
ncbi:conserved hypothetical protein (plasmid) [Novosphingobium sp. PP1Y]|nr:conserved hypothetical protein [Novosphingobium sp. PP1Y]